ncbi:MAG: NAD-dependent epimerase/dehydratase family protein [Candidatus Bathyarchaeota archaeon]|jgi:nucleoside-diphosphate-sugar epimerase
MPDTVLVTGASGWLGNRLCQILGNQGRAIRAMVIPAHREHLDILRLRQSLPEDSSLEITVADVTDETTLGAATRDVDTVFHCVGVIHPQNAKAFYEINAEGTRNTLEACINSGVRRFIYVSSNAAQGFNRIYEEKNGERVPVPLTEEMPCHPESDYGRSKLEAERIVNGLHEEQGIETVIIRPPMYYGPRLPERTQRLYNMVRNGLPLVGGVPVFGGGYVYRSVVYLDNVCEALLLAENSKKANGETYWIADEGMITWREYLETVAAALDTELEVFSLPRFVAKSLEMADMMSGWMGLYVQLFHVLGEMGRDCVCSIEKAKKDLGYKAEISTGEGVKRTVDWMIQSNLVG